MRKYIVTLLVVSLSSFAFSIPAFAEIPVRVTNRSLKVKVIAEPDQPRNVNVVSEPAAPRDVNVVNTVNVQAADPLPVVTSSNGGELSFYVEQTGPDPVAIITVPKGKKFVITAVEILINGEGSFVEILTGAEPRVRFLTSDRHLNFGSGVVFNAGETPGIRVHNGYQVTYWATIMGRLIDAT